MPLPPGSRDVNGRLEMPSIAVDHTGTYICEAVGYPSSTPGSRVSVYLRVDSCKQEYYTKNLLLFNYITINIPKYMSNHLKI